MSADSTILIIEDSIEDYEACVAALTHDNNLANPIAWCENGNDALDYLRKEGNFAGGDHDLPGLILLDLNLPGLDGRDVLAVMKNDPVIKRVPVVVMTSSHDQVDIDRCYDAGANSFVVKPISLDGFLASVARLRDYWFKIVLLPNPK